MAAHKGNEYWKLAENPGRPKSYTPEELWAKAVEYFQWCEANPWVEQKVHGRDAEIVHLDKTRPFTEIGFRIFANIAHATWLEYCKAEGTYKEFSTVTTRIKEIIYTQKFEGAAAGFFNSNIIARDLGLREQTDNQHSGNIQFNVPSGKADTKSDEIE